MAMYWAFSQWCNQKMGALAFEAESSYSSIQVWRMDPYEFCPLDPATGLKRCPEDTSATFRALPGFVSGNQDERVCQQAFLVVAPTLTYVNEYNLALTVLNTTFVNVDTATLRPINASLARCSFASVCHEPVHGVRQHAAPVPHARYAVDVGYERVPVEVVRDRRETLLGIQRPRGGDAFDDEEAREDQHGQKVEGRVPHVVSHELARNSAQGHPEASSDHDQQHGLPEHRALRQHGSRRLALVQDNAHRRQQADV
jgi:hypothetical protein